ncbi:Retrovirus-related Pol polyprotein from transposon gypsy [Eumeta japonica]|uniref:Retrovirus-related Pol polyprotein from transposon gypsy n=1 Tax=Eumeta variegata TaxID=151549 RepID=A0A4C1SCH5_EUMVA|nr:Retrovirus-related Pol polyprotein from transposon gypsy [Eumeta japonica]
MLHYPDFTKEFQLTTDASEYALGAVLAQNDRPIMFISRTLSKAEELCYERERDARNYLGSHLFKKLSLRSTQDIKEPLREIIVALGPPERVVIDNEKSLGSAPIKHMLENQFGIKIFKAPPYISTVNGQIERFHSTLSEIMRCVKAEKIHNSFKELLEISVGRSIAACNRSVKVRLGEFCIFVENKKYTCDGNEIIANSNQDAVFLRSLTAEHENPFEIGVRVNQPDMEAMNTPSMQ